MHVEASLYMNTQHFAYCFLRMERTNSGSVDYVPISRATFERLRRAGYPVTTKDPKP